MKKKIIAGITAVIMTFGVNFVVFADENNTESVNTVNAETKNDLEARIEELEQYGWLYKIYNKTDPDFPYGEGDIAYVIRYYEGNYTDDGWGFKKIDSDGHISKDGDYIAITEYRGTESYAKVPEKIDGLPVKCIAITFGGQDVFSENGEHLGGGYGGSYCEISKTTEKMFIPDCIDNFDGLRGYSPNNDDYNLKAPIFICNKNSAAEKFFIERKIPYELYEEAEPESSSEASSDMIHNNSSEINSEYESDSSSVTDNSTDDTNKVNEKTSSVSDSKTSGASTLNPNTGSIAMLALTALAGSAVIISKRKK